MRDKLIDFIKEGIARADAQIENDPKQYEIAVFKELKEIEVQEDNFKDKSILKIGASSIGQECMRALYYTYHDYPTNKIDSRLHRLFFRGKLEEAHLIAYLKMMGFKVHATDDQGRQYFFNDMEGHFAGHCDGLIEFEDTILLLEMKTMNDKSFINTQRNGCKAAHPRYYSQMQVYMGYFGLKYALFMAVNKNNDEILLEVVEYDSLEFLICKNKAREIIEAENEENLPKLTASDYRCRYCNYRDVCYGN